jgi:hypothetical protein
LGADGTTIYLKLGDLEPFVRVDIVGEDSDLRLRVPQNMGLKVTGEEYHAYLVQIGLLKSNGGFVNEGFDTLEKKIEVDLEERLASFSIDFF